jgi:hypothetical protein
MEDTMKAMLCTAALALGVVALPEAKAQTIRAEVVFGEPYHRDRVVHVYDRPVRRRVVVHRYEPRVIVVNRFHRGRALGHYKHGRGYRSIRAWYDRDRRVYYDGYRPGLRLVTVFEIGGRYYDNYRDDRYDRDRYDDRYHDRYDDRYDERYDDRYDD